MSTITDKKITDGQRDAVRVQHQPNRLTGTPKQNQKVFDDYAELIREHFNEAMDAIDERISTNDSDIEQLKETDAGAAATAARESAESASGSAQTTSELLDKVISISNKRYVKDWDITDEQDEFEFTATDYTYNDSDTYEVFVNGLKLESSEFTQDENVVTLNDAISGAGNTVEIIVTTNLKGKGIADTQLNDDYTLTINYDDGTSTTTESIRGEKGEKGDKGNGCDISNIYVSGLVLDGVTDNTQRIVDALSEESGGVFIIPYKCNCNRDTIVSNLDPSIVIIDPYYQSTVGSYVAKYFKLLTAKNEPNNDSVVIVEDFHHPCITINNEETSDTSVDRHATLGFANGYDSRGFLKFSFMLSQGLAGGNMYYLAIRRMSKYDGTHLDKTSFVLNELGQIGFNEAPAEYDYAFGATDRTANKLTTSVNIYNPNNGTALLALNNGSSATQLSIYTDPTYKGIVDYGGGQQIKFPDASSILSHANHRIFWTTISGATPSATKGRYFVVNNSSAVTMTSFTSDADIVTFLFVDGNTTLKKGAFLLKGSVDWTPTAYSTITFIKNTSLTGAWIELSRNEM